MHSQCVRVSRRATTRCRGQGTRAASTAEAGAAQRVAKAHAAHHATRANCMAAIAALRQDAS
eukprot:5121769-Alexandrium_andersonii.AAC.1